jgi:hypothetical protein
MSDFTDAEIKAAAETMVRLQAHPETVNDAYSALISSLNILFRTGHLKSLVPLLPLMLKLKGVPYSLHEHFPMEPLFSLNPPRSLLLKTGRQVSKSTTLAAQGCIRAATIPYFSSLYVSPRYDQTRRFSNNYVRPFLAESPLGHALLNVEAEQSVLQRTFSNGAALHFSFAFLDANRIRGYSADEVRFDEVQDIDPEFFPVILETLSASRYDLRQYAGTPKTLDNALHTLWEDTSQAEWIIPCNHCSKFNVSSVTHDLLNMIRKEGLSCAKCGGLIDAAEGHWEHAIADRRFIFAGYHVPQIILPMHYMVDPSTGRKDKWATIWDCLQRWPKAKFWNEKLGEACDVRVNLISRTDIQGASILRHSNNLKESTKTIDNYVTRTMGVDWGGGGEKGLSYTALAILGHRPDGRSDLLYGERFTNISDPAEEAATVMRYFRMFKCSILGHDFGGAGAIRETLLIQAGFPISQIFPSVYVRASASDMVTYKPPLGSGTRFYYSVDKARSLVLICQMIKHKGIRFPKYESWEDLSTDILALVEDKHEMPSGPDAYLVTKKANKTDDFAHALNYAALCHWHATRRYPDMSALVNIRLSQSQIDVLEGADQPRET